MIWLFILAFVFAVITAIFWLLQWRRGKTYKPTKEEIRRILQSSIDDTISQNAFDKFSCTRIAYNWKLDEIRGKYNEIVGNPEYIDRVISPDLVVPLNETGKSKLRQLIDELNAIST